MAGVGFSAPPVVNTLPSLKNRFFNVVRLSPLVRYKAAGAMARTPSGP